MFQNPAHNIAELNLTEGLHIADLGAGTGHYSIEAARAMNNTGSIYAVEVQKDFHDRMMVDAKSHGFSNITPVWGDIEKPGGTRLRDSSVDVVFMCNVLFQLEHKQDALKEASRILKSGGRILFIDWSDSHGGMGPQSGHVFREPEAQSLFESAGFSLQSLSTPGAHHYGFIAKKA